MHRILSRIFKEGPFAVCVRCSKLIRLGGLGGSCKIQDSFMTGSKQSEENVDFLEEVEFENLSLRIHPFFWPLLLKYMCVHDIYI